VDQLGDPFDAICAVFGSGAGLAYLGEGVTMVEHQFQAAAHASAAGSQPSLIVAALVHDIGHMTGPTNDGLDATTALAEQIDARHDVTGARWLSRWFGPDVTEPVRLHVAAKRYLVATDPAYLDRLSPASIATLHLQGGPMSAEEIHAFSNHPSRDAAIALRWFDEAAKDPLVESPPLSAYADLIRSVAAMPT